MNNTISVKPTTNQQQLKPQKKVAKSASVTQPNTGMAPDLILATRRMKKRRKIQLYVFAALVSTLVLLGVLYFASP